MTDRRFLQPPPGAAEPARVAASPGFARWMREQDVSLAYTSYQTGRLILAGVGPDERLAFVEQDYARAMGVHWHDGTLTLASLFQVWQLRNLLLPGEFANRAHDCVLVPRVAHVTGYVDAHDVAPGADGRPLFVSSSYSCIAAVDDRFSFTPLWRPWFVSDLVPADKCHLNGFAVEAGVSAYATAVKASDIPAGWRDARGEGGVLIDVRRNVPVTDRLSMPHSPRLHDGTLYLLESGRGMLVSVDPATGETFDVAFCPGFARGLALHGRFALVGLSLPRDAGFADLPLQAALDSRKAMPWCGIAVVDLRTGAIVEWLRYESAVTEIFAIAVLPGVRNPTSVGPATEELLHVLRPNPMHC